MKLGVVGSRDFNNYSILSESLDPLVQLHSITTIVSGGARGADCLAEKYAKEKNLLLEVYLPDIDSYYPYAKACKERNILIVKASIMVIAFWDGKSRGTKHAIDLCNIFKKECLIVPYD